MPSILSNINEVSDESSDAFVHEKRVRREIENQVNVVCWRVGTFLSHFSSKFVVLYY